MKQRGLWALSSILLLTLVTFQNCGDVSLRVYEAPSKSLSSSPDTTYLNIEPSTIDEFRAVFIIDMSHSMFAGACPDSVDTMIDNVNPVANCLAPSGADPGGNRFQIMLNWIADLEAKVQKGTVQSEKVKVLILPFAGKETGTTSSRWSFSAINTRASKIGITIDKGFVPLEMAKNYLYFLWALEAKIHDQDLNPMIHLAIRNHIETTGTEKGNAHASTGTSIVAPAIDNMNSVLLTELASLKTNNKLNKSHFEIHYFSDGVPKPHALHIEAAVKYVWLNKKEVCDYTYSECIVADSKYITGWMTADAKNCAARCGDYLKQYADTGVVSLPGSEKPTCTSYYSLPYTCAKYSDGSTQGTRWGRDIKCNQCFEMVRQFDYTKSSNRSYFYGGKDLFQEKTSSIWGDWLLNRHSNIIEKLKTTVNIFKIQYPGPKWKMNFNRLDSSEIRFKTSAGELDKRINWIEKAKDYFSKQHGFSAVTSNASPTELFSEIGAKQVYDLGTLFIYNRNFQGYDSNGKLIAKKTIRSDGVCLDLVKEKYGQCVQVGCDPQVDQDGDGLNQCEEYTVGTDDFDPDSDGDGILDGSELIYSLNPISNDQLLTTNPDGYTNFEHFIKGYTPNTNLNLIPEHKKISIQTQLVDKKIVLSPNGVEMVMPGYKISVNHIPLDPNSSNEIVVVARVDNYSNKGEKIWLSQTYTLKVGQSALNIKLEELKPLKLGAP